MGIREDTYSRPMLQGGGRGPHLKSKPEPYLPTLVATTIWSRGSNASPRPSTCRRAKWGQQGWQLGWAAAMAWHGTGSCIAIFLPAVSKLQTLCCTTVDVLSRCQPAAARPGTTADTAHHLRLGVSVVGGGVEEVDAPVKGFLDCRHAFALVDVLHRQEGKGWAAAHGRWWQRWAAAVNSTIAAPAQTYRLLL
jgi:hypothetical protein